MRTTSLAIACVAFALLGCGVMTFSEKSNDSPRGQELPLTFGGFIENHPDRGELSGTCTPDAARSVLNCDLYNGLLDWTLTEVTVAVTWSPYGQDDKRYYREIVSI